MKRSIWLAAGCLCLSTCAVAVEPSSENAAASHTQAATYAASVQDYEARRQALAQQRGIETAGKAREKHGAFIDAAVPTDDSPVRNATAEDRQ